MSLQESKIRVFTNLAELVMSDNGRSFTWQTGVAIGSLAVSLSGNWIQYQNLQSKKTELAQAQTTLDATLQKMRDQKDAKDAKRRDMELRMSMLDQKLVAAEDEIRVASANVVFGRDKVLASAQIRDAYAQKEALINEKKALQEKIDNLPID
ncbi:hypothetical protein Q4S45_00670 [Massilia sp. R2A-15]|uniref:hypothetical protein n=1 Tax=Massilia sp. R2A-15 TaxID=3064278 RepID=UPI002734FF6B|nr:hypothetical protein [Massilia sp. R2A-15]WLI89664.1 hypothetical protein Q4S45_00670 [Massilia sp. R2A-15]